VNEHANRTKITTLKIHKKVPKLKKPVPLITVKWMAAAIFAADCENRCENCENNAIVVKSSTFVKDRITLCSNCSTGYQERVSIMVNLSALS